MPPGAGSGALARLQPASQSRRQAAGKAPAARKKRRLGMVTNTERERVRAGGRPTLEREPRGGEKFRAYGRSSRNSTKSPRTVILGSENRMKYVLVWS